MFLRSFGSFWCWPKVFILTAILLLISPMIFQANAATADGKKGLLALGSDAPDFTLTDVVNGKTVTLDDFKDKKALLVVFMCRHCPYVQHVKKGLAQLGEDYQTKNLAIVAISANDPAAFKEDAPEKLKEMAVEENFTFPVLFDGAQDTAKTYTAVATPDFFLFNKERKLVYRGQFDSSRPMTLTSVTGKDVRAAIDAILNDQPVPAGQKPAMGCSIKWKPGNQPVYMKN